MKRFFLILLALFGVQSFSFGQSVTVGIGSNSGTAGSTVELPITLTSSGGAQAAGLQWSFSYSSDITGVTVVAGSAATNAGKSVTCSGNNCLILGFNSTAMANGTVAIATFQIAANPSTTTIPIQISGVVASTASGASIPASGGSGTVSLAGNLSSVSVGLSPSNVALTASQSRQFTATVTGNANTSVVWSMNPTLGTLSNGLYTAPSVINAAQSVTITATSVADPTKSASATVQLTPTASVSVSVSPASATLTPSQAKQFTATVSGNANTAVTWSMAPAVGTLVNGFYSSPAAITVSQTVTITATSVADPTKSASATVQLTPTASVSVGVSPQSATLTISQSTQFAATVTGSANTFVTWSMNPSVGTLSNGLYTAPSVINTAQPVVITATSIADPTKSASATVQLTPNGVSIGVSPQSANLKALQTAQFAANVTGNANTSVTWSLSPSVGSLSNGVYTAPSLINTPQSVAITATSVADPTKSATAMVLLTPTSTSAITITSPTSQPTFAATQNTINLAGTAPSNTTEVVWATDQGVVGQATGTINWTANGIVLRNGSNRITVTARDGAGNQSSVAITAVYTALAIVTTSLPDAQAGQPYTARLAAVGGTPPLTWLAAPMPNGLVMGKDGAISGTASTDGTFTIKVTVQDAAQTSITASVKLRVDNGLVLVSAATLRPGPVAPDSMVTVFGGQLASGAQSATQQPLPTTLGDSAVTVTDANGVARDAGLYYVSPSQVNFKVPTDTASGAATITVTSGSRSQVLGNVDVADVAPGLFFLNSDGLAAADVTRVNGSITTYEEVAQLDVTTNQFVAVPIDLGSATDKVYLTIYGTGFRNPSNLKTLQISIANVPVTVDFAGPSPTAEGLDIVRVLLPQELRGMGMASVGITVNNESSNPVSVLIK